MNIVNQKGFRSSASAEELSIILAKQMNNIIPDLHDIRKDDLYPFVKSALIRVQTCFAGINNKYYCDGSDVYFNHLHSDHYCSFVYLVSNECFRNKASELATKLFLLNKYLHGLDLYFSVSLPEVFMLVHPVGSVVGNANYSDKIVIYQNCTIGSVYKDDSYIYPSFGKNVVLYSRTSVLGGCELGDNVIFGANTFVLKEIIPGSSLVTGASPDLAINTKEKIQIQFFS